MRRRLVTITLQVFRLKSLEEEVMELRDQVDILKPAEAKLTMMEETLSRFVKPPHKSVFRCCGIYTLSVSTTYRQQQPQS